MDSLYSQVFNNKYICKVIFDHVRLYSIRLRISNKDIKVYNWDEIYSVRWMIENNYIQLFKEKFKRSLVDHDRFQLSYSVNGIKLLCQKIQDYKLFLAIYKFVGSWMFEGYDTFNCAVLGGNLEIVKLLYYNNSRLKGKLLKTTQEFENACKSANAELIEFIYDLTHPSLSINWDICGPFLCKYGNEHLYKKYYSGSQQSYHMAISVFDTSISIDPTIPKDVVYNISNALVYSQQKNQFITNIISISRIPSQMIVEFLLKIGDFELFTSYISAYPKATISSQWLLYPTKNRQETIKWCLVNGYITTPVIYPKMSVEVIQEIYTYFNEKGSNVNLVCVLPDDTIHLNNHQKVSLLMSLGFHDNVLKSIYTLTLTDISTIRYLVEQHALNRKLNVKIDAQTTSPEDMDFIVFYHQKKSISMGMTYYIREVVSSGRVDLIIHLLEKHSSLLTTYDITHQDLISWSITSQNYPVFKYIMETYPKIKLEKMHLLLAGNLKIAEHIQRTVQCDSFAPFPSFVKSGNLPFIKFINQHHSDKFDIDCLDMAARKGQLSIFQYIYENNKAGQLPQFKQEDYPEIYEYLKHKNLVNNIKNSL
ncbi:hypothetical protein DLAC_00475 [Tieghemostelium lacteum]|uniref:Ankyrin repeat-containing protein n=1 Tax=Tieghemostelium lacteum TaxID=361077 RepID=A0A152A9T9_TIELA|nr:hypothetical protein DLAC_00475 [Tieghemostelium lacteum]|eukprot:KYR02989.1 hypothetical protein DLAC_00475 [Tieghemostelium lacteum]